MKISPKCQTWVNRRKAQFLIKTTPYGWETLTFAGDYRYCSKCKMLKSVIWLQ